MSDYYKEFKKLDAVLFALGIPLSVDAAMDILLDDGMEMEKAAKTSIAAWLSGRDPEAFARHMVELRKAARGE